MKNKKHTGRTMYYLEKAGKINYFKKFDYALFICIAALSIFGLVVLKSATQTMPGSGRMMLVQIISIALGAVIIMAASIIDYRILKPAGLFFYALTTLFLILVLFRGVGREELGSSRWLILPGGMSFQPCELAKVSFIIVVADCLERIKENHGKYNVPRL